MDLWRAANDGYVVGVTAFARRRADAESYLRNPGYGGARLWRCEVAPADGEVLDLIDGDTGGLDALSYVARLIGTEHPGAIGVEEWIPMVGSVAEDLVRLGYRWVRLIDSHPEDCETWLLLRDEECAVEDAMEEVGL